MNLFYVDQNPEAAAQALCDKHVVKMPIETAQMLCAVTGRGAYEATDALLHHPATLWAKTTTGYRWMLRHGLALCAEYTHRYGKVHASQEVLEGLSTVAPSFPVLDRAAPNCVMPTAYWPPYMARPASTLSTREAYRLYYGLEKRRFARYTNRTPPEWFLDALRAPPTLPLKGRVPLYGPWSKSQICIGQVLDIQPDYCVVEPLSRHQKDFPVVGRPFRVYWGGSVSHPHWELAPGYRMPLKELQHWRERGPRY